MLPRSLYELLPYIYLVVGAVSGLMIDSSLIFIASLLLILAGTLTLYMRRAYRKNKIGSHQQTADIPLQSEQGTVMENDNRSGFDRRKRKALDFPLIDYAGFSVSSDRRLSERRGPLQSSFA